jgi:hypothetical protein
MFTIANSGCKKAPAGKPHTHHDEFEVTLCGLCGDVKDHDGHTCKQGATLCTICGLHKGSPLCCSAAINGRRDVLLCRKCGELAFSKKDCQEGIALCPKCGLHKGSPGCCKIEPAPKDAAGKGVTHAHEGGHDGGHS